MNCVAWEKRESAFENDANIMQDNYLDENALSFTVTSKERDRKKMFI